MKIPIAKPLFDENEKRAILETLESGWVMQGPKVQEFERVVSEYVGGKFGKATSSGTAALHLALIACGIGRGDEVILPPFTCVASANPVEYVGAKPVFVDIDLKTFNIDVSKIEEAITENTKAIMPVHLFGLCADMGPILRLAKKYGLKIIEDAALALGAFYKGKHAGTFGDVGCFSFHPRKMITTGEGGMIITNHAETTEMVEVLRNYGAATSAWQRHHDRFHVLPKYHVLGYNYKMTDLQASIGVEQMKKLPLLLNARKRLAETYDQKISDIYWLRVPQVPKGCMHAYQSYVCLFAPNCVDQITLKMDYVVRLHKARDRLMNKLAEKGITTVQGAQAIHATDYYRKKYHLREADFAQAWIADRLSIALPLLPQMSEQEQEYVIGIIKSLSGQFL
jgi:perosamine synthetase